VIVRVLSMNIWGVRGDWPARRTALADELHRLDPDLLTLQETIVTDGYDQVADVLEDGYHILHGSYREPDGQGITIASRWPVTAVHDLDLQQGERTADFACCTLIAQVQTPDGPLVLANHFPSYKPQLEAEREAQAVIAARAIEKAAPDLGVPVIVAGDMDADPCAASIRFWTGLQAIDGTSVCYHDAWEKVHPGEPGHTYTPQNPIMVDGGWPFRRIDFVLVRCGEHGGPALAVDDCRIVLGAPVDGVQASDHYGVLADLHKL
jgi:endonuclease/exonuclease/phosphatase family metal-dependent hydrolase